MIDQDLEMIDSRELRLLLGLSDYQVTQLIKRGGLPAFKMGPGRNAPLRFRKQDVQRWLQSQQVDGR